MYGILHLKPNKCRWYLWIARVFILTSAVGVLAVSYFFYDPHVFPVGWLNQQTGQALIYGGILLGFGGLMWIWPRTVSALALLYIFFRFVQDFSIPHILPPLPLYFSLYGMFIIGSSINFVSSLLEVQASHSVSSADKRIRWTARILTLFSVITFIIAFTCITRPVWFLGVLIPVVLLTGIAWIWSVPGGILMMMASVIALINILPMHYDFDAKTALVVPWLILLVGGALYIITGWMQKRRPTE